ncbi:hypothetical protein LJK88_32905 [Paenibacillus sp. P26]|nr:hypothetical protein LJK88_32905 [Paenibacillus sp. P26]
MPAHRLQLTVRLVLVACALVLTLLQPVSTAQAGIVDRVKEMYQLPEQMESMQQEFEGAKRRLEEEKNKLAESVKQSSEALELLREQNKRLQDQNAALQSRIQMIEQAEAVQHAQRRNIMTIVITVLLLAIGYFLLGRLLRIAVWKRQKNERY